MNWETFIGIAGAFGGLEALKWIAGLRSSRRKAASEAAETFENVITKRVKTYEDSILFLQNQLQEKERQFAELSARYQESMQRGLELTRALGEMKLRYRQSRCDRKECDRRKPPFPWLRKATIGCAALFLILCPACTKKIYVPVETIRTVEDSTHRVQIRCDTVVERDSIWMEVKGDTVVKESWKFRERVSLKRDTVYIAREEKEERQKIVETEKPQRSKKFPSRWLIIIGIALAAIILKKFFKK